MICAFRSDFLRDVKAIRDRKRRTAVDNAVATVEKANRLQDLAQVKRLKGNSNCYCFRIGDWRIGLYSDGQTVEFVACGHRREIYRRFP